LAFAQPNGSFGAAAFDSITATTGQRVVQFALRLLSKPLCVEADHPDTNRIVQVVSKLDKRQDATLWGCPDHLSPI